MIRVGVVGASGYTGGELVRLLIGHREAAVTVLASRGSAGKAAAEVYPNLRGYDLPCVSGIVAEDLARNCDVVFMAAPAGVAATLAKEILTARPSVRIVDLGADFRLKSPASYQEWYGVPHEAPDLAAEAAYGLPELYRDEIRKSRIVANPGCYPTAALLALAPLVNRGIVDLRSFVIDAKSGVSGAGRTPSPGYHFPECEENLRPYGVPRHRHIPEIEQELRRVAVQGRASRGEARRSGETAAEALDFADGDEEEIVVTFTPHLVPMSRGILVTAYGLLKTPAPAVGNGALNKPGSPGYTHHDGAFCPETGGNSDTDMLTALYEEFYARERFVRVLRGNLPETKAVRGSNFCDIAVRTDMRTGRVVVFSALDNLVKGAAGQAIQNMNILFGLEESTGLETPPVWP
ncbi:MAG: N-acetyl-gamma-glutamyl-phosphate reductase [Betaproteobacteria bacterium]